VATGFPGFPPETLKFFRDLKKNNRREWFQPRKELFECSVKQPMTELVTAVNGQLIKFAPGYVTDPKKAIFRIYRDTRFSADKTPYKNHLGAWFPRRGLAIPGAGFYFGLSVSGIEIGGGIYHPPPETLLTVRTHMAQNHAPLRAILAQNKVKKLFGGLKGSELRRVPKGFDASHPAADLIRKTDWLLDASLPPATVTKAQLYKDLVERFRAMTPFIEYLNQPLARVKPAKDLLQVHF
jgi:uncharacterized protein (TIGR02453 family)